MSNLIKRTLTGVVFVAIIVLSITIHPLFFGALFFIVSLFALFEFQKMFAFSELKIQSLNSMIIGGVLFAISFLIDYLGIDVRWLFMIIPLVIIVLSNEVLNKHSKPFENVALTIFSIVYVVLPFVFLSKLGYVLNNSYNFILPLVFFCMVWTSDTGAYLVGVSIGKRRLFPRVSPKKSWEGFIGGVMLTIALGITLSFYVADILLVDLIVMGLIISVMGTWGDLTESLLKRSKGVKDSSDLLPGHGGILDRFDALTYAAPLVYLYFQFFR